MEVSKPMQKETIQIHPPLVWPVIRSLPSTVVGYMAMSSWKEVQEANPVLPVLGVPRSAPEPAPEDVQRSKRARAEGEEVEEGVGEEKGEEMEEAEEVEELAPERAEWRSELPEEYRQVAKEADTELLSEEEALQVEYGAVMSYIAKSRSELVRAQNELDDKILEAQESNSSDVGPLKSALSEVSAKLTEQRRVRRNVIKRMGGKSFDFGG